VTPSIFIAGTAQHSGKTLVSLGLLGALRNRGYRAAYMKPVGQRTVNFHDSIVDEDVALINQVFATHSAPTTANPVTIPSGYTRRFLAEGCPQEELTDKIIAAHARLSAHADVLVIEGTGHAGVGAVIGLSNARVARLVGSSAVIVSGGGIGRPLDEFELNHALFQQEGVPVLGMISNKVLPDRMEDLGEALRRWLSPHGHQLFGTLPYEPSLATISVAQIAEEIGAEIVSGADLLHRKMSKFIIGAAPCQHMLGFFSSGVLMITPGDREDLVLAAITWDQAHAAGASEGIAVCVTSNVLPHRDVVELAVRARVPLIAVPDDPYSVAAQISSLVAKIMPDDAEKVLVAQRLVESYLDVDGLIARLGLAPVSAPSPNALASSL
jgi:BioD-like phosphotransacetylase family protein